MKTPALKIQLTAELRRYVSEQVRAGRYQDEHELARDAIRQMQWRATEQFERLWSDYPGSLQGEPTTGDDKAIRTAIDRYRDAKRAKQAA